MTVMSFRPHSPTTPHAPTSPTTTQATGRRLHGALHSALRGALHGAFGRLQHTRAAAESAEVSLTQATVTALRTTAAESSIARGTLRLALHDGVERVYLLDPNDFAATTSPEVAYDARVHAAYILAAQGHRAEWLAPHLDLPLPAARAICARAERHGPNGPRNAVARR